MNEPALPRSFPFFTFFAMRERLKKEGMVGARKMLIIIVLHADTKKKKNKIQVNKNKRMKKRPSCERTWGR